MYGRSRTALIVFLVLTAGVFLFVWRSDDGLKTYKNTVYRYELQYPSHLVVHEYADDDAVFGAGAKSSPEPRAQARVITAETQPGQNQADAIAEQLKNLCAVDGPDGRFECTDTLSIEPFATALGESGVVFMLQGAMSTVDSSSALTQPKGPYYAITLSRNGSISKVLVLAPPMNLDAAQSDAALIRSLAESVILSGN